MIKIPLSDNFIDQQITFSSQCFLKIPYLHRYSIILKHIFLVIVPFPLSLHFLSLFLPSSSSFLPLCLLISHFFPYLPLFLFFYPICIISSISSAISLERRSRAPALSAALQVSYPMIPHIGSY